MKVNIIGAGLAGCEAANFLANRGVKVRLFEQKPQKYSDAHKSPNFAELVCSNSLKSMREDSSQGMLKYEMKHFGSLVLEAAYQCNVPAGGALAVDRDIFSQIITDKIKYNTSNGKVTYLVDKETVPQAYVDACISYVKNKFEISLQIISNDYYKIIYDSLGQTKTQ